MTREFDQRKKMPYPDLPALEGEAMRFVKSWHRYPPLHDALWYRGINLGEMDEYDLFPDVLSALVESDKGPGT